jgi:hypothetical protein
MWTARWSTFSAKPIGVGAISQLWILAGERSSLMTHIAATAKRFVMRAIEKLTAFIEIESALQTFK